MSYEEYWHGDVWLAKDYRDAWEIEQKMRNYHAWLNGMYTYTAVSTALYNAFREKGKPAEKYPTEPFGEAEEKTVEQQRDELYERLKNFKEQWDGRHKNESHNGNPSGWEGGY